MTLDDAASHRQHAADLGDSLDDVPLHPWIQRGTFYAIGMLINEVNYLRAELKRLEAQIRP
jgi:hypothetical protein